jgi:membrane fusion protein (multidrug efflux system)
MSTSLRRWLVLALVAAGLAAMIVPRLISSREGAAAGPPPEEAPLQVRVFVVEPRRLVERLATTGSIEASERVEVVSEISGKVEEILFAEGSVVKKGQVLVRLDDRELVAERDRATYRLELARKREQRQQTLLTDELVSQDEYDLALNQLNILRAELELAETQLVKTEIRAPFGGVIGFRYVSPGSFVAPQDRIATLQAIDPVKVEFTVPEAYSGQIQVGDSIEFRVKGGDDPYAAVVYAIEPSVDRNTRSLRLRAQRPNPDGHLLPGAFADVSLAVREVDDALTVPSIAVVPELGGKKVFVVEDGRAEPRLVHTGIRTEAEVQVTSGLEPGERVIVSGIQQLRAGRAVEVMETP